MKPTAEPTMRETLPELERLSYLKIRPIYDHLCALVERLPELSHERKGDINSSCYPGCPACTRRELAAILGMEPKRCCKRN